MNTAQSISSIAGKLITKFPISNRDVSWPERKKKKLENVHESGLKASKRAENK